MTHIPVGTKLKITEYVPLPQSRPSEADAHPLISVISEKIEDLTTPFDIWSVPSEISHFWEYFLISAIVLLLVKSLADRYFRWKYSVKISGRYF